MRGRIFTTLGALAAAAALVFTLPGTADAASGTFFYHESLGSPGWKALDGPADDTCLGIAGGLGPVFNATDRIAELYGGGPGCTGRPAAILLPLHGRKSVDFGYVEFVPHL